jgi:hypothetical protein
VYSNPDWVEEVANRGEAIYQERIKPLVDPLHYGKFLVIDVETGDYEIGERIRVASKKLRERRPEAITYGVRVGFLTAHRMGGRNWIPDNDDRKS